MASQQPAPPQQAQEPEAKPPVTGLHFDIARSIDDVLEAWRLVYESYLRVGFIRSNPYELHTVPQAIGSHTLVVLGRIDRVTVSTISAFGDNPRGLPLDSMYHEEINELRAEGRKIVEVGLIADRRHLMGEVHRTFYAIFELMRYTYYFGRYLGVSDFLCGIPPKRARLYYHAFGFQPIGEVKSDATVENNPVQLLRAETDYALKHYSKHRALAYFIQNPIPTGFFEDWFRFTDETLAGSPLENLLKTKSADS